MNFGHVSGGTIITSLPLRSQRGIRKCVELICCVKIRKWFKSSFRYTSYRMREECNCVYTVLRLSIILHIHWYTWCKLMPNVNRPLVSYPISIKKKTGGHEYVTMRLSGWALYNVGKHLFYAQNAKWHGSN